MKGIKNIFQKDVYVSQFHYGSFVIISAAIFYSFYFFRFEIKNFIQSFDGLIYYLKLFLAFFPLLVLPWVFYAILLTTRRLRSSVLGQKGGMLYFGIMVCSIPFLGILGSIAVMAGLRFDPKIIGYIQNAIFVGMFLGIIFIPDKEKDVA